MTTSLEPDSTAAGESFDPMRQFQEVAGDVRDPYPMLHGLREAGAVLNMTIGAEAGPKVDPNAPKMPPVYTVCSYEVVQNVLNDNVTYSSKG